MIVQYLAIYSNEKLPNSIKNSHSWIQMLPNTKYTLEKLPKTLIISHNGEISPNLVTLNYQYPIQTDTSFYRYVANLSSQNNFRGHLGRCFDEMGCLVLRRCKFNSLELFSF